MFGKRQLNNRMAGGFNMEVANDMNEALKEMAAAVDEHEEHEVTEQVVEQAEAVEEVEAQNETTKAEVAENSESHNPLEELFASEARVVKIGGANQLTKTAQLTNLATKIAHEIFEIIATDPETYQAQVLASQKSHDAMDDLINELYPLGTVDIDFLKVESEETLEKMIRSQQSKRSRAKSKPMTKENYLTMMVGAIAENLLRLAANKPKSSGGGAVMGEIGFSPEDLEHLAQYPEDLKRAIRNIQSKKSIMKSKADFDPTNPRWLQLLRAEQQLKEIRDRINGSVTKEAKEALEAKQKLEEMLATTDIDKLPPEEAKRLLDAVKEMLASK